MKIFKWERKNDVLIVFKSSPFLKTKSLMSHFSCDMLTNLLNLLGMLSLPAPLNSLCRRKVWQFHNRKSLWLTGFGFQKPNSSRAFP